MRGGLFCLAVILSAARVAGQATGALSGSVYDSLRARGLADASVILEGSPFSVRTDSAGRFAFDSVPAGPYTVSVESASLDSLGIGVASVHAVVAASERVAI